MEAHRSRSRRVAVLTAVLAALAVPLSAQSSALETYVEDFSTLESKFADLAGAMGADAYGWRPMEGVRSVSEVYMLIAAEAYFIPSFWGGEPPTGIEIGNQIFQELSTVTDKDEVLGHLERSFAYCSEAMEELTGEVLEREISFFGQQRTVSEAIFILLADMHEHLGQAIAYARVNRVVPPWSAGSGGG